MTSVFKFLLKILTLVSFALCVYSWDRINLALELSNVGSLLIGSLLGYILKATIDFCSHEYESSQKNSSSQNSYFVQSEGDKVGCGPSLPEFILNLIIIAIFSLPILLCSFLAWRYTFYFVTVLLVIITAFVLLYFLRHILKFCRLLKSAWVLHLEDLEREKMVLQKNQENQDIQHTKCVPEEPESFDFDDPILGGEPDDISFKASADLPSRIIGGGNVPSEHDVPVSDTKAHDLTRRERRRIYFRKHLASTYVPKKVAKLDKAQKRSSSNS